MRSFASVRIFPQTLLLLLFCSGVWANPDDTHQAWLDRVDAPAQWINIKGAPEWIEGPEPRLRAGLLLQTFKLRPAESITVRVPAGERIRLYRPDGLIDPEEYDLAWSNGSGLYAPLTSAPAGDRRSLLATPPNGGATLVRIHRKQAGEGQVELALLVSRDANRLVASRYRETMTPISSTAKVRVDNGSRTFYYWHAHRGAPIQLKLDGSTRISIDSRLLFPERDGPFADSYRIFAYLDGEPWQIFDLATLLDTTAAVAVDGCTRPIGRPAYAYLDLPEGHRRLELRVQRPLLVRILARQQPDDYLYRGNLPLDYNHTVGADGSAGSGAYFWKRTEAELETSRNNLSHPDSLTYLDAVRVAQDNAHRSGGVSAIWPVSQWAGRYPAQHQYQAMAARRRLLHSFYRDLLPLRGTDGSDPLFAWFLTPHLEQKPKPVFFMESYAQSLAGNLASGFFTEVPSAIEGPQEFQIPERFPTQELRVAVDRTGLASAETFYIQMDDAQPLRLQVDKHRAVSASGFRPNTGGIALSLLQDRHPTATPTLSGAFATRHAAAPLANVGFLELPLTRSVRRLRLWREGSATQPLRVALAYRTSGWYRMSESAYLHLLDAAGPTAVQQLFRKAISEYTPGVQSETWGYPAKETADSRQQDMHGDLYNQWLPLLRLVYSRYASLTAGVEEQVDETAAVIPADPAGIEEFAQQAQTAERSNDWHTALEKWSWIEHSSQGPMRTRARSRQIHALQQLGNGFLAKQLLRHDFLYARQAARKRQALQQLVDLAEREEDLEGLLTLRAAAAILDPSSANLKGLAASLAASGRSRFALQTLLAIPEHQRPAKILLETAYELGWWKLFEQTLTASGDSRLNALWRGYRAQLQGDYEAAFDHWQEAGQAGKDLSRHLTASLDIRDGLVSPDRDVRRRSLISWEDWQRGMPGEKIWRSIPQSVSGHSGARSLFSIAQEDSSDLFRASPEKPVTVAVYGPTSLRFEVRPLHDGADADPINDWISISSQGGVSHYPVIDNKVSADLRLAINSGRHPGRKLEIQHQLAAGYQELKLSGSQTDLLIGVSALRPRFPLTTLPPLTPQTVRSVLATGLTSPASPADPDNREAVQVNLVQHCRGRTAISLSPFAPDQRRAESEATITPPTAQWFRELESYRTQTDEVRDRLAGQPPQAALNNSTPSLKQRLIRLLWEAEQQPQRNAAALAQAEELMQGQQPYEAGVESILRRLRRNASWQLVRSAQESAGVRLIEFTGWQPEAPEMKTRKALLALQADDEQVISGRDTRVLSMYNLQPVETRVKLVMQDLAYLPSQTMRVLVAWDDEAPTEVLLHPRQKDATLVNKIGAGHHLLRIRIAQPLANQFLRIRVNERRGDTSSVVSEPVQRSYMLATRDQPLVMLVPGPTRLRIDEWRDGRTLTSYRTLQPGWQRVVIRAEPGHEEALLRVFRRTLEPDKPLVLTRVIKQIAAPVAEPLWPNEQPSEIPDTAAAEPLSEPWLADATWSLTGGLVSRRLVDDEPQESTEAERFLSLGGAYRYFSDHQHTYYHADAGVRLRDEGDPTLASRASMSTRNPNWPLDLDVSGSLFLQHVDATGDLQAAATLRGRISRSLRLGEKVSHRPYLSLFQRGLSLDELPRTDPQKVDQDIFTSYKHDHQRGLRIGDRIQYRPWLDSILYAGAYLTSNEDLNITDPDHLGLNIGARQLMGDWDLGIGYNHFHYFKDTDRNEDRDSQRLRLELGFNRWFDPRRGVQARLRYEYDQESADSSIFLTLSLNRSEGGYYRYFKPGELDFRWLRQRRVLEQQSGTGAD